MLALNVAMSSSLHDLNTNMVRIKFDFSLGPGYADNPRYLVQTARSTTEYNRTTNSEHWVILRFGLDHMTI